MTIEEMKKKFGEIDGLLSELLDGLREGPGEGVGTRPGLFHFGKCEIGVPVPGSHLEQALVDVRQWIREIGDELENPPSE